MCIKKVKLKLILENNCRLERLLQKNIRYIISSIDIKIVNFCITSRVGKQEIFFTFQYVHVMNKKYEYK